VLQARRPGSLCTNPKCPLLQGDCIAFRAAPQSLAQAGHCVPGKKHTASPRLGGRKLKSFVAAGLAALTLATIADTASAMISGECSSQYFVARYSADVGSYYYYTAVRATAYQYGSNSTLSSPWRIFFPGERLDRLEYIPIPPGTGYWAEALEAYWWDGSQWIFAANLWVPVGSGIYGYYCLF
jgi:hypothetical protein